MRGTLVLLIIIGSLPKCLVQPWIGVLMFSWISFMNPHKYAWGPARSFPVALVVAIATLVGLALTRDKQMLPKDKLTIFMVFLWMVFVMTTPFAINQTGAWSQLIETSKIFLMIFVSMILINDRRKLRYLLLTVAFSLGLIGAKGGLFAMTIGGGNRVYGPEGTFIGDNNDLALALNMALPMMFYLWKTETNSWIKLLLRISFMMSIIAVIFTYSRGGFLALGVVGFLLMVKARHKSLAILMLGAGVLIGSFFIPSQWGERMGTIKTYEQDGSATGRLNAWATAWNLALDRPLIGGGFQVFFVRDVFVRYAPDPRDIRDVHSSYFEMLGEQGFIGLGLYLSLLGMTLTSLMALKRQLRRNPEIEWAQNYPDMLQVSLLAYMVGGAFLGRAYFDLLYQTIAVVVILKKLVYQEIFALGKTKAAPAARAVLRPVAPRYGLRV
jgi:probable O-glycosylation ligase (exosortase A-associated)